MEQPNLATFFTQLIPLIDAALAIGNDKELMGILTRIAYHPETIDKSSCTEREQEVLNALSCSSRRNDADDADCERLSERFSISARL